VDWNEEPKLLLEVTLRQSVLLIGALINEARAADNDGQFVTAIELVDIADTVKTQVEERPQ